MGKGNNGTYVMTNISRTSRYLSAGNANNILQYNLWVIMYDEMRFANKNEHIK